MPRTDPFFRTERPHTNGYIESLHRTYGEAHTALPSRGDELFKRAYEFRQREKANYEQMQRTATEARAHAASMSSRNDELKQELDQLKPLFEQLSKLHVEKNERPRAPGTDGSNNGGAEHAGADARSGGGGDAVQLAETGGEGGQEVGGDVPVKVLRPEEHVRGQREEHAAEGSELGSGSGATTEAAGGERGVQQDPK